MSDSQKFRDAESFNFFKLHHYVKEPPPWGEISPMTVIESLRFSFDKSGFRVTKPDGTSRVNKFRTISSTGPNTLHVVFEESGKEVLVKVVRLGPKRIHVCQQVDGKDVGDGGHDMIRAETATPAKKK